MGFGDPLASVQSMVGSSIRVQGLPNGKCWRLMGPLMKRIPHLHLVPSFFVKSFLLIACAQSSDLWASEPTLAVGLRLQPDLASAQLLESGWTLGRLPSKKLKSAQATSSERDPRSDQVVSWKGVSVATLVEQWIERLPGEQRATIDLIVFEAATDPAHPSRAAHRIYVPRWLLTKHPEVRLAYERAGKSLGQERGPWALVIPWTSKKKITQEELPLQDFFQDRIDRVVLSNYRAQFPALFMKRRSDPVAMRGEKLFVQNCMSCHATEHAPPLAIDRSSVADPKIKKVAASGHPTVPGGPTWGFKDRKALINYLDGYRRERPNGDPGVALR